MTVDLTGLNPQQREAVKHTQGPLLVLAGAGSGKTRVITFRIAYLLSLGIDPKHILALSFTNKAAQEMRERLVSLVGDVASQCQTSTFHALGVKFLKREHKAAGLQSRFTILDEGDQLDAVRQAMIQLHIDPKRFDPAEILRQISDFKSKMINPAQTANTRTVAMCYEGYLRRLRVMNAVDFEDLIRLPVILMESHREVRLRWRHMFKYIMVDEYQDTNGAQLKMLKLLAEGAENICVVGDDDQSIYGWRGAVASNILNFNQHFTRAHYIALNQNYRSTNFILKAANQLIQHNLNRHSKTLWSAHGEGERLRYRLLDHGDQEGEWVAQDISSIKGRISSRGQPPLRWSDFAVLYRTNQQARVFEECFRTLNIPYQVIGGARFFDRKEIRDMIAYLRVLVNPSDENALRRIINYPPRGIGDQTVIRLAQASVSTGLNMWALCADPSRIFGMTPTARQALRSFYDLLTPYKTRLQREPWSEVFLQLVNDIKLREVLARQYKESAQLTKRWANIQEIANGLASAQTRGQDQHLNDYLNRISLDHKEEKGEERDEVTLMSLHSSKGLEFHSVYLVGVEEVWMPHQRVIDEGGSLDEERRLVYVGITRAQRQLTLTSVKKRLNFGKLIGRKVSRFLREIPDELFEGGKGGEPSAEEVSTQEERVSRRDQAFERMFAMLKSDR